MCSFLQPIISLWTAKKTKHNEQNIVWEQDKQRSFLDFWISKIVNDWLSSTGYFDHTDMYVTGYCHHGNQLVTKKLTYHSPLLF